MWTGQTVFLEDLKEILACEFIDWNQFQGKHFLITGATGLIGQNLVGALAYASITKNLDLKITALVRSREKAERLFHELCQDYPNLMLAEGAVENPPELPEHADYIIHGASMTSSKAFVSTPVELIRTAVLGTENMLEYAKNAGIEKMVFLSSMEVYGYPARGHRVREDEMGALPSTVVRNSYPISKQMCESLCCAYASEYRVPVAVARLTQTFGPGVQYDDGRVFAEFARSVIEKRDIILKTKGETERSYLYTADAVTAVLVLLQNGQSAEAYNVANADTYCSIAEMARLFAETGKIGVQFIPTDASKMGYANTLYMDLDTSKLEALNWKPNKSMVSMIRRLVQFMGE